MLTDLDEIWQDLLLHEIHLLLFIILLLFTVSGNGLPVYGQEHVGQLPKESAGSRDARHVAARRRGRGRRAPGLGGTAVTAASPAVTTGCRATSTAAASPTASSDDQRGSIAVTVAFVVVLVVLGRHQTSRRPSGFDPARRTSGAGAEGAKAGRTVRFRFDRGAESHRAAAEVRSHHRRQVYTFAVGRSCAVACTRCLSYDRVAARNLWHAIMRSGSAGRIRTVTICGSI